MAMRWTVGFVSASTIIVLAVAIVAPAGLLPINITTIRTGYFHRNRFPFAGTNSVWFGARYVIGKQAQNTHGQYCQ
jgi:hypothetical protein